MYFTYVCFSILNDTMWGCPRTASHPVWVCYKWALIKEFWFWWRLAQKPGTKQHTLQLNWMAHSGILNLDQWTLSMYDFMRKKPLKLELKWSISGLQIYFHNSCMYYKTDLHSTLHNRSLCVRVCRMLALMTSPEHFRGLSYMKGRLYRIPEQ